MNIVIKMSRISDVEVINFLKTALQLKVTREQLMKPTTEFIILIYGRFLNEFNIDKLNQPDLMSCSTFSNIEYMEKTIFYINITNAISKLLSKIGFEDITLQDIITPKRNRTMAIISGLCSCLINYINVKVCFLFFFVDGFDVDLIKFCYFRMNGLSTWKVV